MLPRAGQEEGKHLGNTLDYIMGVAGEGLVSFPDPDPLFLARVWGLGTRLGRAKPLCDNCARNVFSGVPKLCCFPVSTELIDYQRQCDASSTRERGSGTLRITNLFLTPHGPCGV